MSLKLPKPTKNKIGSIFVKEYLNEWTDNTTIHGIRYLGEKKRSVVERIWWIIVLIFALGLSSIYISEIYKKYKNEPVIVSVADKAVFMWNLPFPAITICPNGKSNKNQFNFSEAYDAFNPSFESHKASRFNSVTDEEKFHLESLSHLCDQQLFMGQQEFNFTAFDNFSSQEIIKDLYKVSPKLSILHEDFNTEYYKHDFDEIITNDGVCKTFNLIKSNDFFKTNAVQHEYEFIKERKYDVNYWDLDDGYRKNIPENEESNVYPCRSEGVGKANGFKALIYFNQNFDERCNSASEDETTGLKIYIHSSMNFPAFLERSFNGHSNKEIIVKVVPKIWTMSDGLKSYSPQRRKCYLSHERELSYFKNYTHPNCALECLSNYTLATCGCVHFSMPRNDNIPICGIPKIKCYRDAIRSFKKMKFRRVKNSFPSKCKCLPNCNYFKYDYTFTESDVAGSNEQNKFIRLIVFFSESESLALERSARYGFVDLISNCGGLLGLFMGVSILSVIEIIYFFTVRLIFKCTKRNNKDIESN